MKRVVRGSEWVLQGRCQGLACGYETKLATQQDDNTQPGQGEVKGELSIYQIYV